MSTDNAGPAMSVDAYWGPDMARRAFFVNNLAPATLGDIIGGAVIVGAIYWFAYLLPEHRKEMQACRPLEE